MAIDPNIFDPPYRLAFDTGVTCPLCQRDITGHIVDHAHDCPYVLKWIRLGRPPRLDECLEFRPPSSRPLTAEEMREWRRKLLGDLPAGTSGVRDELSFGESPMIAARALPAAVQNGFVNRMMDLDEPRAECPEEDDEYLLDECDEEEPEAG